MGRPGRPADRPARAASPRLRRWLSGAWAAAARSRRHWRERARRAAGHRRDGAGGLTRGGSGDLATAARGAAGRHLACGTGEGARRVDGDARVGAAPCGRSSRYCGRSWDRRRRGDFGAGSQLAGRRPDPWPACATGRNCSARWLRPASAPAHVHRRSGRVLVAELVIGHAQRRIDRPVVGLQLLRAGEEMHRILGAALAASVLPYSPTTRGSSDATSISCDRRDRLVIFAGQAQQLRLADAAVQVRRAGGVGLVVGLRRRLSLLVPKSNQPAWQRCRARAAQQQGGERRRKTGAAAWRKAFEERCRQCAWPRSTNP